MSKNDFEIKLWIFPEGSIGGVYEKPENQLNRIEDKLDHAINWMKGSEK